MNDDPNKTIGGEIQQHGNIPNAPEAERDESRPYAVPTNIDMRRNPTTRQCTEHDGRKRFSHINI